jgi:hypothetical protein
VGTSVYSLVHKCFGLSIAEQLELDTLTFAQLSRDAFCLTLQETPDGKEYLDKAYRYTLTEPDIKSLREQFGKS